MCCRVVLVKMESQFGRTYTSDASTVFPLLLLSFPNMNTLVHIRVGVSSLILRDMPLRLSTNIRKMITYI